MFSHVSNIQAYFHLFILIDFLIVNSLMKNVHRFSFLDSNKRKLVMRQSDLKETK